MYCIYKQCSVCLRFAKTVQIVYIWLIENEKIYQISCELTHIMSHGSRHALMISWEGVVIQNSCFYLFKKKFWLVLSRNLWDIRCFKLSNISCLWTDHILWIEYQWKWWNMSYMGKVIWLQKWNSEQTEMLKRGRKDNNGNDLFV